MTGAVRDHESTWVSGDDETGTFQQAEPLEMSERVEELFVSGGRQRGPKCRQAE